MICIPVCGQGTARHQTDRGEHYAVMVNDAAYLMLGASGHGNYPISCPSGRIADGERTEKHPEMSVYAIKFEGTFDLPVAVVFPVLADIYAATGQTLPIESLV
jgi:hypothetical protein